MIDYAMNDTRLPVAAGGKTRSRTTELGRWEWFQQSCAKAVQSAGITRQRDTENQWRITGSVDFRGRAAALLRALWTWREEEAKDSGPSSVSYFA